jgi:hypothetical protein
MPRKWVYKAPRVTIAMRRQADRVLRNAGIIGYISDAQMTKLIRACMGRAWEGNWEDWLVVLEGVCEFYVRSSEQAGAIPKLHPLYFQRKVWVRSYATANKLGTMAEGTAVLYEKPTPLPSGELPAVSIRGVH